MRKIRGILIVLLLVLLAGCKRGETAEVSEETETPKIAYYQIEDSYIVPLGENSSQCRFYEDKVYCLEFEGTDDDSVYYLKSYDRNGETREYRSDAISHITWKSWCIHKDKTGDALSILSRNDSGFFIVRMNMDTLEAQTISVEDDMFRNKIIHDLEVSADNKYLLDGYENIYVISKEGKFEKFTYKMEGYSLFASDKNVGLQNGQILYSNNLETAELLPVCSLSDSRIRKEDVLNIVYRNEKYYVLTEEEGGAKVNILVENKDVVKEEKIQLVLYQPFIRTVSREEIDEFNFENEKYEVVNDIHSADVQFRFLMEDIPDIICLSGYDALALPDYAKAGYIRDLYPLIDKSEKIQRDDLLETMIKGLETDGKLYGISEKIAFQTPFIYSDADTTDYDVKTAIDTYVKTAKEHNLAGLWSVESLEELVFTGLMDDILKDENGNPGFNAPLVREMLECIKNSGADVERKDVATMNIPTRDYYFGSRNSIENVADVSTYTDGYNLKIAGYPSLEGEPVFLQRFSDIFAVSAECECPEGAFEFIEFMMTRSELYGNQTGSLYCLKSLNEQGRHAGTLKHYTELLPITNVVEGEEFEVQFADEKFDFLRNMSEHVVLETMEFWNVIGIIDEETGPYFRDEKSIDEVMNIIESRIRLMLAEK